MSVLGYAYSEPSRTCTVFQDRWAMQVTGFTRESWGRCSGMTKGNVYITVNVIYVISIYLFADVCFSFLKYSIIPLYVAIKEIIRKYNPSSNLVSKYLY